MCSFGRTGLIACRRYGSRLVSEGSAENSLAASIRLNDAQKRSLSATNEVIKERRLDMKRRCYRVPVI